MSVVRRYCGRTADEADGNTSDFPQNAKGPGDGWHRSGVWPNYKGVGHAEDYPHHQLHPGHDGRRPPAGAELVDEWQLGLPPYRIMLGAKRYIDDECNIWVRTSAAQYEDGRIDDDGFEPPRVHMETGGDGLTVTEALRLPRRLSRPPSSWADGREP